MKLYASLFVCVAMFQLASQADVSPQETYPIVQRDETICKDYFGTEVCDPYQWLEKDSNETTSFIEGQNAFTSKFLDGDEIRDKVYAALEDFNNYNKIALMARFGENYIYFYNHGLQSQSLLVKRHTRQNDTVHETLIDTNTIRIDGTASIGAWEVSWDNKLIAYGITGVQTHWQTVFFKDISTGNDYISPGKDCSDKLEWIGQYRSVGNIVWDPKNEGIFYKSYPDALIKKASTDRKNVHLYYHRIGTEQSDDVVIAAFPKFQNVEVSLSHCKKWLFVSACESAKCEVYVADMKMHENNQLNLTILHTYNPITSEQAPRYKFIANTELDAVFLTNKNAPNYMLVKINLKNESEAIFVKEDEKGILQSAFPVANDKLILKYWIDLKYTIRVHSLNTGELIRELPGETTISELTSRWENDEIYYKVEDYYKPGTIYKLDLSNDTSKPSVFTELKVENFDGDEYESKVIFFESTKNTTVQMHIVHKKNLTLNGENPCLLYRYGGAGTYQIAYVHILSMVFMKHFGGVYAVPYIRGGPEMGMDWYQGGRLKNRQNSFDDFHAAAEALVTLQYTNPKKLGMYGLSIAGLVMAACINQRPELYTAAVIRDGVLDMLRFSEFRGGRKWVQDYGDVRIKEDFAYIKKFSPLHNIKVKEDAQYPATLLQASENHASVLPLHSYKFIATLQHTFRNVSKQRNRLIIRVDKNAGLHFVTPLPDKLQRDVDLIMFLQKSLELPYID